MYPCDPSGRTAVTSITMSIDEAEELARQLVAVVTDARGGRFSEHGVKVAEDMRLQDLKEAWLVLGIEDLNNGE
jgi:FMN-dependent NADH-azoreductase